MYSGIKPTGRHSKTWLSFGFRPTFRWIEDTTERKFHLAEVRLELCIALGTIGAGEDGESGRRSVWVELEKFEGSETSGRDSDLAKNFAVRSIAESVVTRRASCSQTLSMAAPPRRVSPAKQKSR